MTYLIFGDTFTFPEGTAATNRVYNYAKGFIKSDINVEVISFGNDYIGNYNGTAEGINYYHPFHQNKRNRWFIKRSVSKVLKYYNTLQIIKEINNKDRIFAIHCYTSLIITHLFAYIIARLYRIKLVIERGEHPLRNSNSSLYSRLQGKLKLSIESNLCDSIFCISKYLIEFYSERGVKQHKLFLIPSTVDTERFNHAFNSLLSFKYILYCGSLSAQKDGIDILIESFSRISDKFPDINLVLIGRADTFEEGQRFKDLVKELNISNRVFFLGQLARTDVPAYLCNAAILTLARPKSMIADAGFPSKLTEYLATGNPVLVSKVGDIPVYLKDNENAFFAEPNSVESFAHKLDFILCNYEFAQEVGQNGKKLSDSIFNYEYQATRIIDYLRTI